MEHVHCHGRILCQSHALMCRILSELYLLMAKIYYSGLELWTWHYPKQIPSSFVSLGIEDRAASLEQTPQLEVADLLLIWKIIFIWPKKCPKTGWLKMWRFESMTLRIFLSLYPQWEAMAFKALYKASSLEGKQLQLFQNRCALFVVGLLSPHNACVLFL